MKEISKAEFIRRVTQGKTEYVKLVEDIPSPDYVLKRRERKIGEIRTCKATSNLHLEFSNGKELSHLRLADVKPHTFYKCYEDDGMLVVDQEYHDSFDNNVTHKYLYYKEV